MEASVRFALALMRGFAIVLINLDAGQYRLLLKRYDCNTNQTTAARSVRPWNGLPKTAPRGDK
jgi:hypothetical protein